VLFLAVFLEHELRTLEKEVDFVGEEVEDFVGDGALGPIRFFKLQLLVRTNQHLTVFGLALALLPDSWKAQMNILASFGF